MKTTPASELVQGALRFLERITDLPLTRVGYQLGEYRGEASLAELIGTQPFPKHLHLDVESGRSLEPLPCAQALCLASAGEAA